MTCQLNGMTASIAPVMPPSRKISKKPMPNNIGVVPPVNFGRVRITDSTKVTAGTMSAAPNNQSPRICDRTDRSVGVVVAACAAASRASRKNICTAKERCFILNFPPPAGS